MRIAPLIARTLSIVGHPFVVVPAAVAALLLGSRVASPWPIVGAVSLVVGAVAIFSYVQVRLGRWQHIDASLRSERRSLNLFLALLLLCGAAAFYQPPGIGLSLGLLLAGLLIVVALLVSPWAKLSLHASFAAFAVSLLWPLNYWYLVFGTLAAAAICWSRLSLGRHKIGEVIAGCLLGGVFGAFFWLFLGTHG